MTAKRRQYTAEVTREAVRLIRGHGYKPAEAARTLGIKATMLRRWQRECAAEDTAALRGHGRLSPEQEARRRLREETKRLRMARDILTHATAFFATESS
jgi:transposase